MKGVSVVRIRWPKGTERVNIKPTDTIGILINYMGKKYNFPTNKLFLIQETTKQKLLPSVKLSSLKMENGEQFMIVMKSDMHL